MDGINIFWKDLKEHIHQVDDTLTTVGEVGVTRNRNEVVFIDSVDYLGLIFKTRRLEIDQSHTKSLMDAKPLTNR